MAKLLKHQLKENIRDILPWMVIPLIAAVVLSVLNSYFESEFLKFILFISLFVLCTSFVISTVIVILNDYKRFYGQEAAFYDVLPIKSSEITASRVLNIMIVSILVGIILAIELLVFFTTTTAMGIDELREAFKSLKIYLDQIQAQSLIIGIVGIIVSLLATMSRILASITIGSDKVFKDLGKFGPVIVFILISIVVSASGLGLGFKFMGDFSISRQVPAESGVYLEIPQKIKGLTRAVGIGTLLNLVVSVVQIYFTNLFYKKRLTVE